MDCERCSLKYGPYCTDINQGSSYSCIGNVCSARSFVRTEVGNFYACPQNMHQFGSGTMYGTPGWYAGR